MEDERGEKSAVVIGLIENRAKEVGVAAFDLRSASLHLSQYIETSSSYQNTKTLLLFYDPMVIIVPPNKLAADGMVGVSELVNKHYSSAKKIVMSRGCFDETKGASLVKYLAVKEPSALGLDTYHKQYYLCLAAAATTVKWTEAEKGIIITSHSLSMWTLNGQPFAHITYNTFQTYLTVGNVNSVKGPFMYLAPRYVERLFPLLDLLNSRLNALHIISSEHSYLITLANSRFNMFPNVRYPKQVIITFNGSFDHMNIDATSIQNLEIIEPLHTNLYGTTNKKKSLFQMLKTTKTTGGTRLLRANLLQPLKDIETINARLDCLDELMSNEALFFGLSQGLKKFPKETDRVLCHFCFKPKRISDQVLKLSDPRRSHLMISNVIILKTALDALPFLTKVLKDAKSFLLSNIYRSVCENENYPLIKQRILDIIDEDVLHTRLPFVACTQQCFAVKSGVDALLDVARRAFCGTSEAIHNLASKYREEFNIPNLKLPFNNRKGFYITIPLKDVHGKLPEKFIQVVKHGKAFHCSTLELASLNARNKSAAAECFTRTEICLEGLIDKIRDNISFLILLAEVLCLLDMLVNSFAHMISTKPVDRYTRPEFTEDGPMAVDGGRHPILEGIHSEFVPNSIFLSEASNMAIVMGPNMSGKSTYLQQVCLIIILAQIGCYVPARFASLRVADRIFTRIGTGDNLESNSSTFMTEMRETAFIMQNISPRSLVVMDELGRATSSSDGFSIAWSCCEHLLSLNSYTIFATHMEGLSELATVYPNVKIFHFEVDINKNRLDFKFRLMDGPRKVPHYGLLLAEVAGLPTSVVETARTITTRITQTEIKRMVDNCEKYQSIQLTYSVAQRLICLKYSNQDDDEIRRALQSLKDKYLEGKAA